jgi:hypothetical protein
VKKNQHFRSYTRDLQRRPSLHFSVFCLTDEFSYGPGLMGHLYKVLETTTAEYHELRESAGQSSVHTRVVTPHYSRISWTARKCGTKLTSHPSCNAPHPHELSLEHGEWKLRSGAIVSIVTQWKWRPQIWCIPTTEHFPSLVVLKMCSMTTPHEPNSKLYNKLHPAPYPMACKGPVSGDKVTRVRNFVWYQY